MTLCLSVRFGQLLYPYQFHYSEVRGAEHQEGRRGGLEALARGAERQFIDWERDEAGWD